MRWRFWGSFSSLPQPKHAIAIITTMLFSPRCSDLGVHLELSRDISYSLGFSSVFLTLLVAFFVLKTKTVRECQVEKTDHLPEDILAMHIRALYQDCWIDFQPFVTQVIIFLQFLCEQNMFIFLKTTVLHLSTLKDFFLKDPQSKFLILHQYTQAIT